MPELPAAWAAPGAPAPEVTTAIRTAAVRDADVGMERIARPVPLRPLSVLELIDGAIGAVRAIPLALLGWTSLIVVAAALADFMLTWLFDAAVATATRTHPIVGTDNAGNAYVEFGSTEGAGTFGLFVVHTLLPIVCSGFAVTILAGLFAEPIKQYVDGAATSSPAPERQTRQLIMRLSGLAAVTALPRAIFVALYAFATLLIVNEPQGGRGSVMAAVTFLGAPACVALVADWAVAAPVAALEGARGFAALGRSRKLVTAGRWRTLWSTVLTLAIAIVVMIPLTICQYYIADTHGVRDLLDGAPVSGATYWWLAGYLAVLTLIQVLTAPFRAAVATMLYIDRRFRREGLDIRIAWARVARTIAAGKGRSA
jgi:hypothetical protein